MVFFLFSCGKLCVFSYIEPACQTHILWAAYFLLKSLTCVPHNLEIERCQKLVKNFRHVRWVNSGRVLLPEMWTTIRHEFQLYDVTDTPRCWLDYNVGLSGLCSLFWVLGFKKNWRADLRVECILRIIFDHCTLKYMYLHTLYFAVLQHRVSASSLTLRCTHAFGKCGPCSPGGGGGGRAWI